MTLIASLNRFVTTRRVNAAQRAAARDERRAEARARAYQFHGLEPLEPRVLMSTTIPSGFVPIETISVSSLSNQVTYSSASLEAGNDYFVEVSGQYLIRDKNGNGVRNAATDRLGDGEFFQASPSIDNEIWLDSDTGTPGEGGLEIGIGTPEDVNLLAYTPGSSPTINPKAAPGWQSDGIYGLEMYNITSADDMRLAMVIPDPFYKDNFGGLTVKLWEGPSVDLLADSNNDGTLGSLDEAIEALSSTGFAVTDTGYAPIEISFSDSVANSAWNTIDLTFTYDDSEIKLYTQAAGGPDQFLDSGVTYDASTLGISPGSTATLLAEAVDTAAGVTSIDLLANVIGYDWVAALQDLIHANPIEFDLDVNTADHGRVEGVTVRSEASEITEEDDAIEQSRGGYLWVNDDNDHNPANDAIIDIDDENLPEGVTDNDLERVRFGFDPMVGGLNLQLTADAAFRDTVRLWRDPRKINGAANSTLVTFDAEGKVVDQVNDLVPDGDGYYWAEGIGQSDGAGLLTASLMVGDVVIATDTVALTVFGVALATYVNNNGRSDPNHQGTIEADFATDPTGQTRSGDPIFPDRQSPTDTVDRDIFAFLAEFNSSIPVGSGWHLPFYGQVFDVDHYSDDIFFDDTTASDSDPGGHDAGHEPNDNRTGYVSGLTPTDDDGVDPVTGNERVRFGAVGDSYDIGLRIHEDDSDTVERILQNSATQVGWAGIGETNSGFDTATYFDIGELTPGNNWRFAVGMGDTLHQAVRINDANNDGETLEYINDTALETGNIAGPLAKTSDTLTLWRRLHVERDRMGAVAFFEGPVEERSIRKGILIGAKGNGTTTLHTDLNITQENQFVGGQIQFWDSRFLVNDIALPAPGVTIVSHTSGANAVFTLSGNAPNETDYIWIADDDVSDATDFVTNPQAKVSPQLPDVSLFNHQDAFPAANIEAIFDGAAAAASSETNFVLNPVTEGNVVAAWTYDDHIASGKSLVSAAGYWAATTVGAYQGSPSWSFDPDGSAALWGNSAPYWFGGLDVNSYGGVHIYDETIYDYTENAPVDATDTFNARRQRVTLHEVGHLLGGRHGDGGLMSAGNAGTGPAGGMFSGTSLRRFMLLKDNGTGR